MNGTRRPAPVEKPVVLTVAGSDSGGGAGIQADLKTIEATGGFGTSAITAVTAQNTTGVDSSFVLPIGEIEAQLDAVLSDFDVRAVKTGMLATAEVVETVTEYAADLACPVVVDPVMVAATGDRLLTEAAETAYEGLVAEATLLTPNTDEAAVLTGIEPDDEATAREAGAAVREMGAEAALIKGGHIPGEEVIDVLVSAAGVEVFRHRRIDTDATHGSGCTLSSAIATRLALGESLPTATERSTAFLERTLRYHHHVGAGPGAVHHLVELRNDAARENTAESVQRVVDRLVAENVRELVGEVGMNVAGATPYAEAPAETAAVEGRITKTIEGIAPNRGVRFGASSHVAEFLCSAREVAPELRFAVNCRAGEDVAAALESLSWSVAIHEGPAEDTAACVDARPEAIVDRSEDRTAQRTLIVAEDAPTLADRVLALHEAFK